MYMCFPPLPLILKHYMLVNKTNSLRQQIVFSDTLVSNWLMAVPMTIKLSTHVSLTITSDATTFQPCKQQQIASGNELLLVILQTLTG